MADSLQILDPYKALEKEVMMGMLDLAELKAGEKYIDLGSGDGQFLVEAKKRGAIATGIELDSTLATTCQLSSLNVINGNMFDADVSKTDVITFWFTMEAGVQLLMQKLYSEMRKGARLSMLYSSLTRYRDGVLLTIDEDRGIITVKTAPLWKPVKTLEIIGNRIQLYIR